MVEMRGKARWMVVAVVGLAMSLALGACSGSDDSDGGSDAAQSGDSSGGSSEAGTSDELESGYALDADRSGPASSGGGDEGALGSLQVDLGADDSVFGSPKVIKNGQVELGVKRDTFDDAVREVYFLAQRLQGIVQSTAIDDSGEGRGAVVIRIPSDRFEDALEELRDIGRIESQYVDTQDVTDEFVDLQSRIRNARSAERVLLNLMDQATTIADTIRVQNQLERVQENIERMRGRLRVLDDQTSFSTLAIDVIEAGAPKEEDPEDAGALAKAWHDAVAGFIGVISAVIVASGVLLPVAAMALVVALLVRRLRPRLEREPEAQA
ncbi:MAG TPA: DUF4349 domain-containing protein [Actinomycetota bacterium]|nr:DUF4349 domain-containing protein [Actinomycetota bacterium]